MNIKNHGKKIESWVDILYELKVRETFDAAHFIRKYDGKCAELHGHNWIVEVVVRGERLNEFGMLMDFKVLKSTLNKILARFDHKFLNELEIFKTKNPSAENIAHAIFEHFKTLKIFSDSVKLYAINVYESLNSCATYFEHE